MADVWIVQEDLGYEGHDAVKGVFSSKEAAVDYVRRVAKPYWHYGYKCEMPGHSCIILKAAIDGSVEVTVTDLSPAALKGAA